MEQSPNGNMRKKRELNSGSTRLHRIRVIVANKFELSCNIDRPFELSLSSFPIFSFLDLLKFYAVSRWGPTRKFIDGRDGWVRPYITREKRAKAGFYFAARSLYSIFLHSKEREREREKLPDISVGQNKKIK